MHRLILGLSNIPTSEYGSRGVLNGSNYSITYIPRRVLRTTSFPTLHSDPEDDVQQNTDLYGKGMKAVSRRLLLVLVSLSSASLIAAQVFPYVVVPLLDEIKLRNIFICRLTVSRSTRRYLCLLFHKGKCLSKLPVDESRNYQTSAVGCLQPHPSLGGPQMITQTKLNIESLSVLDFSIMSVRADIYTNCYRATPKGAECKTIKKYYRSHSQKPHQEPSTSATQPQVQIYMQ